MEAHTVLTRDGYLLKMHRIPYGTSKYLPKIIDKPVNKFIYKIKGLKNDGQNKESVLLMHGLLCSAADWVVAGPKIGLGKILYLNFCPKLKNLLKFTAYTLADAGYDVWLANARGTTLSRKHIRNDPDSPQFWQFRYF